MNLPKVNEYTTEVEFPVDGKIYEIRPYYVKEEKIILTAMESEDSKDLNNAVKKVISNCVINEDFDIGKISDIALEWLFLQIRIISTDPVISLNLKCQNEDEKEENPITTEVSVDLRSIELSEIPENVIELDKSKKIGVKMRFLSIDEIDSETSKEDINTQTVFDLVGKSIEMIYQGDDVFLIKEYDNNSIQEWIESLTGEQLGKITDFIKSSPKLYKDIEYKCDKCGENHSLKVEGMENFLG